MLTQNDVSAIQNEGFCTIADAVSPEEILLLTAALETLADGPHVRRRGSVYGVRSLLEAVPCVEEFSRSERLRRLLEPVLGSKAFAVRGILFDKTPDANWKVSWHQDRTIAVKARYEMPGFGPWSEKAGVTHVQPPTDLLSRMLTVRIHLDPCGADNGPLRVLPGSHRRGRLSANAITQWRQRVPEYLCTVPQGGALLMRPLLLHASSAAHAPQHRRVLHLDYAAEPLPVPLQWHEPRGLG